MKNVVVGEFGLHPSLSFFNGIHKKTVVVVVDDDVVDDSFLRSWRKKERGENFNEKKNLKVERNCCEMKRRKKKKV